MTRSGDRAELVVGHATLDPPRRVESKTWFHLFSGTKLYTASAVMCLVDRGQLELDAPVTRYLPELPLRHPVTVRQLMAHASGLPDTVRAFLAIHPGEEVGPTTASALARFRLDRGRAPDGRARYANVNFALLGDLIARVSGTPYPAFLTSTLLVPLGADLRFRYEADALPTAAAGHVPRWSALRFALPWLLPGVAAWLPSPPIGGWIPLRPFALDAAAIGGLLGNATAFLPLLREMLDERDGVLSGAAKRQMLTLQARGAAGIVSREGVGLGWKLGVTGGTRFWNHEGGGPGFATETRVYPNDDLGIVILMNRSHSPELSRVCDAICEWLRGAIA